jgi:hypothetical protein
MFQGNPEPMTHTASPDDRRFLRDLENASIGPAQFDHAAHVRAAYVFLVESASADRAAERMRDAIRGVLQHHALDESKYHETITRAWILAVRHFMEHTPPMGSAQTFIDANPRLLDAGIMMSHYSASLLFSAEARAAFVEPDLKSIPRHE